MKSAFIKPLDEILWQVSHCSFVSCIGAARDHIHQGHIITTKYHPIIYEALLLVLQTDPSFLVPKTKYMTYCKQMFGIIEKQLVSKQNRICRGENVTANWGTIFLLQEVFVGARHVSSIGGKRSIMCDGHMSFMPNNRSPLIAVRCLKWSDAMRSSRGVNIDAVTRVSKLGLRKHLMAKNSQGKKDNKATTNIVGEHLKAKANTVAEIRNMASWGSWYSKFETMDFEKIQDWKGHRSKPFFSHMVEKGQWNVILLRLCAQVVLMLFFQEVDLMHLPYQKKITLGCLLEESWNVQVNIKSATLKV